MSARPIDNVDKVTDQPLIEYPVVKIAANTGGKKAENDGHELMVGAAQKKNDNGHQ